MGEAKCRKEARERPIVARNMAIGERIEIRHAGDPLALRESLRRWAEVASGGRVEALEVPCAGCRACCYHRGTDVYPELELAENLAHLDLEKRADGRFYLRKREDGACIHLGPSGCTVYQHRPHACRAYDCRIYPLFGVLDSFDGDHVQPAWVFQPATQEGRVFAATCQVMGVVEKKKFFDAGERPTANEMIGAVLSGSMPNKVASALDVLSRMPPDDLAKVLGVDPRSLTSEAMARAMQEMLSGDVLAVVREP